MKLILAIISDEDAKDCIATLNKGRFSVTRLATTGGFLSKKNTTLLVGCDDDKVEKAIELIGSECKTRKQAIPSTVSLDVNNLVSFPMEVEVGGATIFVVDVDQFKRL